MSKKKGRKPGKYYVSNDDLIEQLRICYDTGEFPRQLGEYVLKIVEGVAHSPNFMNYSYLEEMKSDAIFRITKAIQDKGCKIVDDDDIGDVMKDDEGHPIYETDDDDEFVLDDDGNKTPCVIKQNNIFAYFSMIAWRSFQNRIKVEKKYHNTIEEYKEKVYSDFEDEYNINRIENTNIQEHYHEEDEY